MDLIRDILDTDVLDRNGRLMGKLDGIVAELRPGRPPVLKAIELGLATKARRLHRKLGRIVGRRSKPFRIAWGDIQDIGIDATVKLEAEKTPVLAFEKRVRSILLKIPGA
ncbi:MAG TPA: hypothetical protein VFL57_15665 [Bryobacteraceae bacterium]|nr:hypothetical protein [Bryobacteraceae bacterium]